MSIFKTQWIILKKIHKSKDIMYIIFSVDYGKIAVVSKNSNKEKKLDIGYSISFELKTKWEKELFQIRNIKIISEFNYLDFSFKTINNYQILISLIYSLAPEKKQIFNIFEIVEKVNNTSLFLPSLQNQKLPHPPTPSLKSKGRGVSIDEKKINIKIILASLKILNIFWLLSLEHKNSETKKILNFINNNNFSRIFLLVGISEESMNDFEEIISGNLRKKKK